MTLLIIPDGYCLMVLLTHSGLKIWIQYLMTTRNFVSQVEKLWNSHQEWRWCLKLMIFQRHPQQQSVDVEWCIWNLIELDAELCSRNGWAIFLKVYFRMEKITSLLKSQTSSFQKLNKNCSILIYIRFHSLMFQSTGCSDHIWDF